MRHFELTPAAQRAVAAAGCWATVTGDCEPPQLLLGLLEEPECRAALLLAAHGIDVAQVLARWPDLQLLNENSGQNGERHSPAVEEVLRAAESRLVDLPRPLILATEHLLLGLAANDSEVSQWLSERGLQVAWLEGEVHRLAGFQSGPIVMDLEDEEEEEFDEPVEAMPLKMAEPPSSAEPTTLLRILDAAANRAGEGLRVIEDYVRFALDDRFLTSQCKTLRHDLTAALARFPNIARHAARDTHEDVGVDLTVSTEQTRADLAAVVTANFKRLEQSLRSLEEYGKSVDSVTGAALEQIRYRVYTLEKAIGITTDSLERLADAKLYVLVDGRESVNAFGHLINALVASTAVDVIQLRDKRLPDRELLERARLLADRTRGTRTLFIMNDRPDLAVLARADGVHVGQDELSVKDARAIVGPTALVGVSTHSLEQARAAVLAGANYIGVGPTFASDTKHFDHFPGPELLRAVAAEIRLPAFAIGGVNVGNVAEVRASGLQRIAVSGAVLNSTDLVAAVHELKRLLVQ